MQDKMINKYIAKNHSGSVFTDNELQVIKDGNIDDMVTTFLDMNTEYYNKQMQSVLKVFTQFMSTEIELERIIYQKEFDGKFVGCQIMDGDIDVFLGIAGEDADLLCVAGMNIKLEYIKAGNVNTVTSIIRNTDGMGVSYKAVVPDNAVICY